MRHTVPIETPDGQFTAMFSEAGLVALGFPCDLDAASAKPDLTSLPPRISGWLKTTTAALHAALGGRKPKRLPPLVLGSGTMFQQQVWSVLTAIPAGETRSYAQVAAATGRPQAARAVGQACGANPIPVLIPCHRVLAARGGLGGFSGGLSWKRLLLEREGAQVRA